MSCGYCGLYIDIERFGGFAVCSYSCAVFVCLATRVTEASILFLNDVSFLNYFHCICYNFIFFQFYCFSFTILNNYLAVQLCRETKDTK